MTPTTTEKSRTRLSHEMAIRLSDWLREHNSFLADGPTLAEVTKVTSKALEFEFTPDMVKRVVGAANVKWDVKKPVKLTKNQRIEQFKAENEQLKTKVAELTARIEQLELSNPDFPTPVQL